MFDEKRRNVDRSWFYENLIRSYNTDKILDKLFIEPPEVLEVEDTFNRKSRCWYQWS